MYCRSLVKLIDDGDFKVRPPLLIEGILSLYSSLNKLWLPLAVLLQKHYAIIKLYM